MRSALKRAIARPWLAGAVSALIIALFAGYILQRRLLFAPFNLCMVVLLCWGTALLPCRHYFKSFHTKNLPVCTNRIIAALAIIGSLTFCLLNATVFLHSYRPTTITLEAIEQTDNRSNGSEVILENVVTNHRMWWQEDGEAWLKIELAEGQTHTLTFMRYSDIKLVFQQTNTSGVVRITDGEIETVQNLYSANYQTNIYKVQSNTVLDWKSPTMYLRGLLTITLGTAVFYAVLKAIFFEHRNKHHYFVLAMTVTLLLSLSYYWHSDGILFYRDSYEYLEFFERQSTFPDVVFVYPVFISICRLLFGGRYFTLGVLAVQAVLSFAAAAGFYGLLARLVPYPALWAAGAVLYGANPAVLGWNLAFLTESLSLSGSVLCLYLLVKVLQQPTKRTAISLVANSLVLVFLRPTFLLLLGLLAGFWVGRLLFNKKTKAVNIAGLGATIASFILVGVYALLFSQTYGYFSISNATPRQALYVCIYQGFFYESSDELFIERVEEALDMDLGLWEKNLHVLDQYTPKEILQLTAECRKKAGMEYWRYVAQAFQYDANSPYPEYILSAVRRPVTWQASLNAITWLTFAC